VPAIWHSAKPFIFLKKVFGECRIAGIRQSFIFLKKIASPSAGDLALDKKTFIFLKKFFVECSRSGTRQRIFSVLFFLITLPSAHDMTLG
jgi:hypothetical protein